MSGFSGSAGTLIVRQEEAYLWTDGRYFIQAEKELAGSCIQLMKYIICHKIGIDYDKQEIEISQLKTQKAKRTGSHNYMIDVIEEIMCSVDKKEASIFVDLIEDLKDFREESDYGNVEILSSKSSDSISKAYDIRKQLINFFHV